MPPAGGIVANRGGKSKSVKVTRPRVSKQWNWGDDVLISNSMKVAAPVSAFRFQKAPLSEHWDNETFIGAVAEIKLTTDLVRNPKKNSADPSPLNYWFVTVMECQGYFFKVRFIGVSEQSQEELKKLDRWVHFVQLKEIGFYLKNGGSPTLPSLLGATTDNTVENVWGYLKARLVGKSTLATVTMEENTLTTRFIIGSQVEVRVPHYSPSVRSGTATRIVGPRVQVSFNKRSENKSTWLHVDSELIQAQGWPHWPKTVGERKKESENAKSRSSASDRPTTSKESKLNDVDIKIGMRFKLINPIKPCEISLGAVTKVLSSGFFKCKIVDGSVLEDDLNRDNNGLNEFVYHISSDLIFPVSAFMDESLSGIPGDDDEGLDANSPDFPEFEVFEAYEALPLPPKESSPQKFKVGMLLEAVDPRYAEKVCPAIVSKVVHPHGMLISFLGWDEDFSNWKSFTSLDIFPMGWCQLFDYPLEAPPKDTVSADGSSPKNGQRARK